MATNLVDQDWEKIRESLGTVARLCDIAVTIDTAADAEPLIGLAMSQLMDASFWCGRLMRDTTEIPLEGMEP